MSHLPHQIRRLVFEAGVRGRKRSAVLQNRISAFARSRLEAVLAESLAPLSGDDLLAFGKVELDLGEISFSRVEDDLAAGIARSMREWAVRALLMHAGAVGRQPSDAQGPAGAVAMAEKKLRPVEDDCAFAIDAVAHFLEWGMLPDSILRASGYSAEFAMTTALARRPQEVCAMVRRLGEKQQVRRRLSGQFSDGALHSLVSALDPVNTPWMVLGIRLLQRLHAERPFVPLQGRAFSQLLWELALEYLAQHNWRALDPASFLRFLLQKLAARQKTSYEVLLADVALRRGWEPDQGQMKETGLPSQIAVVIIALLEEDVFGMRLAHAPHFVVRPAFQHIYSDLDVLAYWLRWRKLPSWSFAPSAEAMAERLGPLLRRLPPELRRNNGQPATAGVRPEAPAPTANPRFASSVLQIERWLLYGLWPQEVALPQNAALADWLERQDESIWRAALSTCGAQEQAVHRIVHHLPTAFLLKITELIAGTEAQLARGFIQALWSLEPKLLGAALPGWRQQVSRYGLLHLLRSARQALPAVSLEGPARATLQALSLRYQISYDRLVQLLRQESEHSAGLQKLAGALESEWKQQSARVKTLSSGPQLGVLPGSKEILLHYLKYGSLAETAPALSLRALQSLAESLDEKERFSLCALAQDRESARRVAALFPGMANAKAQRETKAGASTTEPARPESQRQALEPQEKESNHEFEAKDPLRCRLDALAWLLRNGEVPWWGEELLQQPADDWFKSLLDRSPGPLLQTLRAAALSVHAIDRLIQYVPAAHLSRVVQQAAPDYGGLLILYIESGAALAESNVLVSRSAGLHWRETLLCVLGENSSGLTPAKALRQVCNHVAQKLDVALDHYLQLLLQHAGTKMRMAQQSGYSALAEMLSQIRLPATFAIERTTANAEKACDPSSADLLENEAAEDKRRLTQPQLPAGELSGEAKPLATAAGADNTVLGGDRADHVKRSAPDHVAADHEEKGARAGMAAMQEKSASRDGLALPDASTPAGQLEYLLRYGALPPSLKAQDLAQFMETLAAGLRSHPEEYRRYLLASIAHDIERKRIARLFSEEALSHLWPILLPSGHSQAVFWGKELPEAAAQCSAEGMKESLRHACIEELLRAGSRLHGSRWDSAAYLRAATQRLVEEHSLRAPEIIERLRARLLRHPKNVQEEFRPALDRLERDTAVIPVQAKASTQLEIRSETRPESPVREHFQKPSAKLPAGEPFYIQNAGAVLLWPFLDRYFRRLGLLEQNAFRGETERNRAIHLVQYLARGALEIAEHELLLNKILCGAPAEQPLDAVEPVTAEEEELSTQLLQGLIANWTKLRNTSIAGLRQSFLAREGRLLRRESDDAWSLTVSAKTYDLLLDSLPWRFSTIRLPWMQTVLHVKWR